MKKISSFENILIFATYLLILSWKLSVEASGGGGLNAIARSKRSFFILTGTMWCGAGNKATTCDDLGEFIESDKCCREHDACPYTFTINQPAYNGFFSDKIYSLSHCECDSIFYDCLHERPYKENSFLIWESFASIGVKCFAYIPCSSNSSLSPRGFDYDAFWSNLNGRQTGECSNGSRVAVFDSIFDYLDYLNTQLSLKQHLEIKDQLLTRSDQFYSVPKRQFKCAKMFEHLPNKIASNFHKNFVTNYSTSTIPPPTTSMMSRLVDGLDSRRKRVVAYTLGESGNGQKSVLQSAILVTCLVSAFVIFSGLFVLLFT